MTYDWKDEARQRLQDQTNVDDEIATCVQEVLRAPLQGLHDQLTLRERQGPLPYAVELDWLWDRQDIIEWMAEYRLPSVTLLREIFREVSLVPAEEWRGARIVWRPPLECFAVQRLEEHFEDAIDGPELLPVKVVHALREGRPLCRFWSGPPNTWPDGHEWTYPGDDAVDCPDCLEAK
jgi:hypothetical protein